MDSLFLIFISDMTHRNRVNRFSLMTTLHQMVLKFLNLFKERKVAMVLFGVVVFTTLTSTRERQDESILC